MHDVDAVDVSGAEMQLVDLDDAALLAMARTGHQEAYATLFSRYSYAAHRLARHLGQKEDSDDVVSEAFAQVLDLLGRGKGPERAFRAYLFTTVRHECARRAKARKRVVPTDDMQQIDTPVAFGDGQLDSFERSAIRAAYESLPARWQTVLWHLDVEGRKPHELGPLLDLSPNSVSALVYRARAGLREAYLQQHVKDDADSSTCLEHRAKLSAFVRRTASARDQERIHAHLESCSACMAVYLDLQEVNRDVGVITLPVAAVGLSAASLGAHVLVLLKGLAAVVAPPAAAAALASAAVVGVSGHVPEPTRQPIVASAEPTVTVPPAPAEVPHDPAGVPQASPRVERPATSSVERATPSTAAPSRPSAAAEPSRPTPAAAAPSAATPAPATTRSTAPRASTPSRLPAAPQIPAAALPSVDPSTLLPDLGGLDLSSTVSALRAAISAPAVTDGSGEDTSSEPSDPSGTDSAKPEDAPQP